MKLENVKIQTLLLPAAALAQSPDLMGMANPKINPLGRNIASTRNMVHELAEQSENPAGVFTLDASMTDGLVYPRFLIRRHGCWCNYEGCDGQNNCNQGVAPRTPNFTGMPHKTPLDKNCHKMFNAHRCLAQELEGCTNMRLKYKYNFNPEGNGSIECVEKKNSACAQALCLIDRQFAEELVQMARDDPDEVKSWPSMYWYEEDDQFEAECPRIHGAPASYDGGECCGISMNRSFYKTIGTMSDCCVEKDSDGNVISEEVKAIGLCV